MNSMLYVTKQLNDRKYQGDHLLINSKLLYKNYWNINVIFYNHKKERNTEESRYLELQYAEVSVSRIFFSSDLL